MPHESANPRIAIVGASSLRGKELQQFIEDENLPFSEISLIDTSLPAGTLAEVAGEPTFLKPMDRESFEGVRFVFFCGSAQEAKSNWKLAADAGATIIDLTGALEDSGAAPWIPGLDTLLAPPEAKAERPHHAGVYSSPVAPVMIACRLAAALSKFSPARMVILFFPPTSEREQLGIDELEKQTADLLLLRPISQSVFDAQVAFNLLSSYGEASKPALSETRAEICKRVAAYLCGRVPAPAVQLIQAPVFYGYGFSVYVDVSGSVDPAAIDTALFGAGIHVTQKGDPAPTNVSVAGEAKIHVAHAERDPDVSSGVWLWGVADNLRLAAANAVQIAKELLAPKI
ncbi:MAG TPA: Asd/ArgC dimerization domain-containing protein [Candidatus Acidoferrales bacterium]|nr:Asd/ArgC dimerization domain-containing protein [Candidatus Acidoferrales bacterium]